MSDVTPLIARKPETAIGVPTVMRRRIELILEPEDVALTALRVQDLRVAGAFSFARRYDT